MFDFLRNWRRRPVQDAWQASAYLFGENWVIHSYNRTYNDFGWNLEPVFASSVGESATQLGFFVRAALNASRWDAETPDPMNETSPVLKACGARSWNELERNCRLVLIELRNNEITFYPTRPHARKEGKGWGFVGLENAEIWKSSDCHDEELGLALIESIDRAVPS